MGNDREKIITKRNNSELVRNYSINSSVYLLDLTILSICSNIYSIHLLEQTIPVLVTRYFLSLSNTVEAALFTCEASTNQREAVSVPTIIFPTSLSTSFDVSEFRFYSGLIVSRFYLILIMGCDGGTIPRRDELVRVKKKPEQKDKEAELAFKWRHCTIKQLPLQPPVVGCGLGRLYSKESVLEGLLDRSTLPESAQHIKTLKDVKNLNLTANSAFEANKAEKGDCYTDGGKSPYICPVIGLEMNGKYKFCFLWSCGCVMSERALKEIKSTICHQCQQPFCESDIVIINSEADDLKKMEENMTNRKAMQKKSKKRKCDENTSGTQDAKQDEVSKEKIKKEDRVANIKINSKRNEAEDPAYKKVKGNYSVAKDPKASEVFKSLFTSHKSASEQDRAHWITYNPFYN